MKQAGGKAVLPRSVFSSVILVGAFLGLQVLMGISTLMLNVPVPLAAAHQAGALALLTSGINLLFQVVNASNGTLRYNGAAKQVPKVALSIFALGLLSQESSAEEEENEKYCSSSSDYEEQL